MQIFSPAQRHPITVDTAVPRGAVRAPLDAWKALNWIGIGFFILGFLDIALGWYPTGFGNAEWEFGTISGSLNALAIPMLGLYLMLASAIARSDRRAGRAVAVIMGLMLMLILGLGVIYLTVMPVALKAVAGNALISLGIKKAVLKAMVLGSVDSVLLAVGMVKWWRVAPAG